MCLRRHSYHDWCVNFHREFCGSFSGKLCSGECSSQSLGRVWPPLGQLHIDRNHHHLHWSVIIFIYVSLKQTLVYTFNSVLFFITYETDISCQFEIATFYQMNNKWQKNAHPSYIPWNDYKWEIVETVSCFPWLCYLLRWQLQELYTRTGEVSGSGGGAAQNEQRLRVGSRG